MREEMAERGRLGEVLAGVLRRHHLAGRVREHAALALWPQVVGKDIARNAWPTGVRDGVLQVGVANHAWAQTLHLMRAMILEAMNARLGEEVLGDIQVRVAARGARQVAAAGDSPRRFELPALTRAERQRIRDLTQRIEDPELRAKVGRAAAALLGLRRLRQAQGEKHCRRCGRRFTGRGQTCRMCAGRS